MTKRHLRAFHQILILFGLNLLRPFKTAYGLPRLARDLIVLLHQQKSARKRFAFGLPLLFPDDRFASSGKTRTHTFHQDLWVARRVFANGPVAHLDVGSRIDGLVAHIASFRCLRVLDIRPMTTKLPNIEFSRADVMQPLPAELLGCCDSLSCLHTLEHFGLGRYGDPIAYDGYLVGLDNLHRLLQPQGKFYFSVPIGPQRIEFNARRVFALRYLLELLAGRFRIDAFAFVDDRGDLHEPASLTEELIADNCGCFYGCGIFELTRV